MSVQSRTAESQQIAEQSAPVVSGHTPTPWCFGRTGPEQRMILGSNDRYVCNVQIYQTPRNYGLLYEAEREANAALIVRAVNSHEHLLSALEGLLALALQMNDSSNEGGQLDERYDAARAILDSLNGMRP